MSKANALLSGWRGIALVAITYVYFLIFAQFAFLNRLAALGIADSHLQLVMAAMAAGGIVFSLLAARPFFSSSPLRSLQSALGGCAAAALLSLTPLNLLGSVAVSLLIGLSVGLLTVTLVSNIKLWLASDNSQRIGQSLSKTTFRIGRDNTQTANLRGEALNNALLQIGLGTGLGYLICNFPPLFTAGPQQQAITAASLCLSGIVFAALPGANASSQHGSAIDRASQRIEGQFRILAPENSVSEVTSASHNVPSLRFGLVLICFTALVWLDSAAFFIIQNTPLLKAGTWTGTVHLWVNGLLHLTAALASAWLLSRRALQFVLGISVLALGSACLLLASPGQVLLASVFYPIGVSLYSVALVAYPSLLASASSPGTRARNAGLIYALAGWFGSAMGIGMGQHLGHVPMAFVALASTLVLGPWLWTILSAHRREATALVAVLLAAFFVERVLVASHPAPPALSSIERGRQVYIAEGCISCHSQYVRPNTPDVLMWGPTETLDELRAQHPPLIGNRRQGPDLSQVGGRRSELWLKAHFFDPREVSHRSFMPSYAHLFTDSEAKRGPQTDRGPQSDRDQGAEGDSLADRDAQTRNDSHSKGADMIAYLESLKSARYPEHVGAEQAWTPSPEAVASADLDQGAHLFSRYCGTCHLADGATRARWQASFKRLPPNLQTGPWLYVPEPETERRRNLRLARIIKFGIRNTDMPGHEYLADGDVTSIAFWLERSMVGPDHSQVTSNHSERSGGKL